jgi:hypothetical protein
MDCFSHPNAIIKSLLCETPTGISSGAWGFYEEVLLIFLETKSVHGAVLPKGIFNKKRQKPLIIQKIF